MDNKNSLQQKEVFTAFYNDMLQQLAKNHAENYSELLRMQQELHTVYLNTTANHLEQWAQDYDSDTLYETNVPDKIEADSVTVEITDKNTGKVFRRNLPITYLETANGLLLSGETMDGSPSQIAFLSETAISKISDLCGKGPDSSPCGDKS